MPPPAGRQPLRVPQIVLTDPNDPTGPTKIVKNRNSDTVWFNEWAECRATIGRYDNILSDLRKFGFSLISGLITASALFGISKTSPEERGAGFFGVAALIVVLFLVDTYYQTLLSSAVERALDLEAALLGSEVEITHYQSNSVI